MKYVCLGYVESGKFEGMTEDAQQLMLGECFDYNDHLRANGHVVAEVTLQPTATAVTLYWKDGKVATIDSRPTAQRLCLKKIKGPVGFGFAA